MKELSGEAEALSPKLSEAKHLLAAGQFEQAFFILRQSWLENPDDRATVSLLSTLLKETGRRELAHNLEELAATPDGLKDDVQNLFEAGFKLIDERELYLAAMLLGRAFALAPEEADIAYELGFALMSTGSFAEAIPPFERAASVLNDFDTLLNLSVCYTLTRNLEKARQMVETMSSLAASAEERDELAHRRAVLSRLEKFAKKSKLGARDWLYTLYGNLILTEPDQSEVWKLCSDSRLPAGGVGGVGSNVGQPGTARTTTADYKTVASTLLHLREVLQELGLDYDVVEFYSPLSRPLAEALSRMMDLPAQGYKGPRPERALLVMAWASNIVGPHQTFIQNSNKRTLFAYALSSVEPLPLTPDIVGCLARDFAVPWAQSLEETGEAGDRGFASDLPDDSQMRIAEKILEQVHELESKPETIQSAQAIADYYREKRDLLVLANQASFPERPEYTAEILF